MLPLSELIALIQFEVQKSFEFSEQLMFDLSENQASVLQLAVDVVELDLPVRFSMGAKAVDTFNQPTATKTNLVLQQLDAPFLGRLTAEALRTAIPVDDVNSGAKRARAAKPSIPKEAKQLLIEVGGETQAAIDAKASHPLGRLRLVLKPVLK
jgi:hypothetical protein